MFRLDKDSQSVISPIKVPFSSKKITFSPERMLPVSPRRLLGPNSSPQLIVPSDLSRNKTVRSPLRMPVTSSVISPTRRALSPLRMPVTSFRIKH